MTDLKLNLDTSTGPSGEEPRPVSKSADHKPETQGPMSALPQHTENNSSNSDPEVKVILLTYMRSGSTLTGEVFNKHPRVFFFYEPLWTVDFSFIRAKEPAFFFHRDIMKHDPKDKTQVRLLKTNIISSILHCDFKHMYTQPLTDPLAYLKSRTLQPFKQCKDSHPGLQGLYGCLPVLRQACTSAKVIAMKVVRLPMELAATFLKADPKVKVIHLVRDPRAVLNSRRPSGISALYPQTARQFCDYVAKDLKDSIPLKQQFPGRVLTVRYEDLAQRPLAFSSRLLTFARLDMPPAMTDYVINMTSSNDVRITEKTFETYRRNASLTAASWRRTVQFDFVQDVDRSCGELYSLAGYLPLDSQSRLRNMNEPYFEDYRQAPIKLWDD
ncbi:hypothetical protein V1264_003789 [Littorina saxatilis]|uniref:Sulfotransferase n=1 Tax=Littorina saxatilis TaxID=31220 RepID=A0AAN9B035_9CAEN